MYCTDTVRCEPENSNVNQHKIIIIIYDSNYDKLLIP